MAFSQTSTTLSIPYSFTAGTSADASQVNSDMNAISTTVNACVVDITSLGTLDGGLADNNTWTGTNAFQANVTTYNQYFTATYGIGDQFLLIDSANAGAARTASLRFERGSSGADAYLEWDATRYNFWSDNATTRSIIRHLDGAAANDGMTYGQGVKATGTITEDITGIKTFTTTLPLCATVPTTNTQLINKLYADTQYASVSAGGILQQSSTPAITANTLWIDTTTVANLKFLRANGTVYAPITGIHQGTSAPTVPAPASGHLWIDTTSTASSSLKRYDGSAWKQVLPATIDAATTFTGDATFSTTTLTTGIATFTAVPICSTAATTSTQLTNKAYVDAASPKIFQATASPSWTAGVTNTLFGTGVGSLTIAANTLLAGSVIRGRIPFLFNEDGSPENATWLVKLGAITIATTGAVADPAFVASGAPGWVEFNLICVSIGAVGSVTGEIIVHFLTGTTAATDAYHRFSGTATINTTASQVLDSTLNAPGATGQSFAIGLGTAELYK